MRSQPRSLAELMDRPLMPFAPLVPFRPAGPLGPGCGDTVGWPGLACTLAAGAAMHFAPNLRSARTAR